MTQTTNHRLGAVALLVAPGLTLAAHLVQVSPTTHDTSSELASIAANQARYEASGWLAFLGAVLMVPALLAMARPLWAARPRLAAIGLSMSIVGLLALVSLMGSGPVSLAMVRGGDQDQMAGLTDRYESLPLVTAWVLLMIVGYSLGPILLGVGLWRTGYPWAVPAFLIGGLVLQIADAGRWPLAAGFVLTWAGMALVAVRLLRRPTRADERRIASHEQDRAVV
jgi:hypothetical protein